MYEISGKTVLGRVKEIFRMLEKMPKTMKEVSLFSGDYYELRKLVPIELKHMDMSYNGIKLKIIEE